MQAQRKTYPLTTAVKREEHPKVGWPGSNRDDPDSGGRCPLEHIGRARETL
jgi:hypothetical protein